MKNFAKHFEGHAQVNASPQEVFNFIDDHSRLSSHMNKSSWMMGGGRMDTSVDEGHGQRIDSHIVLQGTAFGMNIFLDEVVTLYEPPKKKEWETVGIPKLIVIGPYRMGVEIVANQAGSNLKVFIDYDLPAGGTRWLGYVLGPGYARWCVKQMIEGCRDYFNKNR